MAAKNVRSADKAITDVRKELARLLDLSPVIAYTCQAGGDFDATYVSPNVTRQLGYTQDEFLAPGFFIQRVHPEDADRAMAIVARLFEEGRCEHEYRFRHKDGSWRHMRDIVSLVRNPDGTPRELVGYWMDITAHRQAAQAVADSENRFRTLFNAAQDAIFLMNDRVFLDCNPAAEALFGRTRADMIGRSPLDVSPVTQPDGRPSAEAAAERIRAALAGSPQRFMWLHLRADGTPFDAEVSLQGVEVGGEAFLQAIARDVTEPSRADRARRRLLEMLDQTGQVAKVGGWEIDLTTQTLRWTDGVFRIHEIDPAVQLSMEEAIHFYAPEARPIISAAVQAAIDTGSPFDLELPFITAGGRRLWVRAQGVAERRDGKTTRIYGAFQDITERRLAGESLRLQSAALQAAADGIMITDRSGTILWVNPAVGQLTGYTFEEAVGKNPRDLINSGKHPASFYREFWATLLARKVWHGQIVNRRKDGSLYTEDMSVTPITDSDGAITHFVAIKRDITERLQLEAQFRQAQKMESVGHLASGVAHDFNNLLTIINGMAELVLEQIPPESPARKDVLEICRAGERAATLTHQLLAFSRQQVLAPRVLNLNTVAAGMESMLRRLLGEDVALAVVYAPDVPDVKVDPGQIEQVIINLAVNARDAMPQGGRLSIETERVTLGQQRLLDPEVSVAVPAGTYAVLAITDSGTGMDEATRARVFEPFFTTKGPGKGTGLGLSTVYGIVKQSQGFIRVYSELQRGTSFKIYLPQAAADQSEETSAEPVKDVPGGTETILVVEDNPGLLRLATRFLEPAGYTVHGAPSAEKALRLMDRLEGSVHLLLTDVVMPGMSGRHLAERLARVYPGMKVLYMSGYTSDTVIRHGVQDAQTAFISKPFTAVNLLRKVREALDS